MCLVSSNCTQVYFDVTISGSHDSAEVGELFGIYFLSKLHEFLMKDCIGLYGNDRLMVLRECKGRHIDIIRKNVIKFFKELSFNVEIETNWKKVNFLDIILRLNYLTSIMEFSAHSESRVITRLM